MYSSSIGPAFELFQIAIECVVVGLLLILILGMIAKLICIFS